MELKVSYRFIDNLQPTNSNVNLLQCYGIFLTSLNHTCTKVKNTPHPCNDPAHQRLLQEILYTSSARWDRNPGKTSPYCSIFSFPTQMKYHSLFRTTFWLKPHHAGTSPSISFTKLCKSVYWFLHNTNPH